MVFTDEDALICDFAETYGILNYKSLPVLTAATLAQGLSSDSRIKRKYSGMEYPLDTIILARIHDHLADLLWSKTKDGQKGRNPPKRIVELLMGREEKKENASFSSAEEFDAEWKRLVGG